MKNLFVNLDDIERVANDRPNESSFDWWFRISDCFSNICSKECSQ